MQLFALLGHGFGQQYHDEVCGAVINLREKGDKIAVWTANADKADVQMAIGYTSSPFNLFYCL